MFIFSENTILLPKKSVTFPNSRTQLLNTDLITLLSPSGGEVYQYGKPTPLPTSGIVKGATTLKPTSPASLGRQTNPTLSTATEKTIEDSELTATTAAATILWERSGGVPDHTRFFSENTKWVFGLLGILLVALAGFIIARSHDDEASIANEYAIIEDIIEGEIKE
jgi:hypothetical protein